MNGALRWAISASLLVAPANAVAKPSYFITIASPIPSKIEISVDVSDLPLTKSAVPHLISRSEQLGLRSQIRDVRCGSQPLRRDAIGWIVPGGCKVASWTIVPEQPQNRGILASEQQSFWLPSGWGVVSEPTSILRLAGWHGFSKVRLAMRGRVSELADLPPADAAPAFFVVGDAPVRKLGGGGFFLDIVADDSHAAGGVVDGKIHMAALRYFRRILPPANRRNLPLMRLVLVGAPPKERSVGGAAGYDTLIVNYLEGKDLPPEYDRHTPQLIALHEQFHQIVATPLPLWANESLAHFYALKAMHRDRRLRSAARELWARCCSPGHIPAAPGLIAVQDQVTSKGDYSSYPLFYTKGAAFWGALDARLRAVRGESQGLDHVLPAILDGGLDLQGRPTQAFISALAPLKEAEVKSLIDYYLEAQTSPPLHD